MSSTNSTLMPTGIYGAMYSAISGDHSVLLAKLVLDFFTAIIFAATMGYSIALMAVPMLIILLAVFCASSIISPLVTPEMFLDFTGCGGLLMLATGFRMGKMKIFRVGDMVPALIFVMPISHYWGQLMGG